MKLIRIIFHCFFIVLVSSGSCPAQGQLSKRQLTEADYNRWGMVSLRSISGDGNWLSWSVRHDQGQDTLFVAATDGSRLYAYANVSRGFFFGKKGFYCEYAGKAGEITDLVSQVRKRIAIGNAEVWGGFIITIDADGAMERWDDSGTKVGGTSGVRQFIVSPSKEFLIYIESTTGKLYLQTARKALSAARPIGSYGIGGIRNVSWSADGQSLTFLSVTDKGSNAFYLDLRKGSVCTLAQQSLNDGMMLDLANPSITTDGKVLLSTKTTTQPKKAASVVEVWNTMDTVIYPVRSEYSGWEFTPKLALWNPQDGSVRAISDKKLPKATLSSDGRFALLWNPSASEPQYRWLPNIDLFTLDLETGRKKCILRNHSSHAGAWQLSPNGKYVTYHSEKGWYNYDLEKGRHIPLSDTMAAGREDLDRNAFGMPVWAADGKAVILFDAFDIWLVMADGSRAKRLTRGRENGMVYRIPSQEAVVPQRPFGDALASRAVYLDKGLVFEATSADHTASGYYFWKQDEALRDIVFNGSRNYGLIQSGSTVSWLAERFDRATEPQCAGTDGTIKAIRHSIASVEDFFWGKVERVSYGSGKESLSGLLYYPAGYIAGKRYPMVVNIYEKQSQKIHHFIRPGVYGRDGFNITNFTSNGYFVLLPDIAYTIGKPGESALRCTEAAVESALAKEPGIERENIGLTGYSFGGYEACYIATKSKYFKAVAAGAGITDFASDYFSQAGHYNIPQYYRYETFQMRMGKPFHEDMRGYIDNSPVYGVTGVSAPVLIYTGGKDFHINHGQSREFYFALRRLGKEGFLLVYPEEEHAFVGTEAMADITGKVEGFFGYYLKRQALPDWMHPR